MKLTKIKHNERLAALQHIAVELIETADYKELLSKIVHKSIKLLDCDAASLYLKHDEKSMVFELAINQSLKIDFEKKVTPLSDTGIAAYSFKKNKIVRVRDAYKLPKNSPYSFNPAIDLKTGYRTQSVLSVPLVSSQGESLGVLQLINRKLSKRTYTEFTMQDEQLSKSFAALASAAIEKANLYHSIKELFEGFIRASVSAIESRDPVTKGHSQRVSLLSVTLAKNLNEFTPAQIDEVRVAALLHDFGKIGVREEILVKAKKLFKDEQREIRSRLDKFRAISENRALRNLLQEIHKARRPPTDLEIALMDKHIRETNEQIETIWGDILDLNEPTVMNEDRSEKLMRLKEIQFHSNGGVLEPVLKECEIQLLGIKKGSLSDSERMQIENHVTQTYFFLKEIPWSNELKNVPHIAHTHHEKLNGTGYPRGLSGIEIPTQARLMTICDIYDALVAADRPYKKAVPIEKALNILEMEAKNGQLDSKILKVFIESKVYESFPTKEELYSNIKKAS